MFTAEEITRATGGRLVCGSAQVKVKGVSTDTRDMASGQAFLALKGDNFDGHDFVPAALRSGSPCIIVSKLPKVRLPKGSVIILVRDTTLALGDLARFKRDKFGGPVIAVTGSNGKTSVKEMIACALSGSSRVLKNEGTKNNQVGLPQTLLKLDSRDDFAVVEIGTNHFGEVDYLSRIARPNIGVITNIGPSHLEFFGDLNGVFREKASLLKNLKPPAIGIVNADDPHLRRLLTRKSPGAALFGYGIKEKCDFRADRVSLSGGRVSFRFNRKKDFVLPTLGAHNVYNALAAIAVCRILGLGTEKISRRLRSFDFPKGRLKLVEVRGVKFIDDTYNANPLSLAGALEALGAVKCRGRKILVMGDMLELGREKELLHRRAAGSITNICDLLVTVGRLSAFTAEAAKSLGFKSSNIFRCSSSIQARELLRNTISPGPRDIILVKGSRSMKMEEVFKI